MTMLDRMRRHKNILKWSLAVVVLTFVLLYIPDFVSTRPSGTGAAPHEVVAHVGSREVTAGEFQQRYISQIQAYRNQLGGSVNAATVASRIRGVAAGKQLGILARLREAFFG